MTTAGRTGRRRRASGARGRPPSAPATRSPTARRRASRSIGSHSGRSGSASRISRWVAIVARRNRASSSSGAAGPSEHQHRLRTRASRRGGRGRPIAMAAGRDRAAATAAGSAITTGCGAADVRQARAQVAGRRQDADGGGDRRIGAGAAGRAHAETRSTACRADTSGCHQDRVSGTGTISLSRTRQNRPCASWADIRRRNGSHTATITARSSRRLDQGPRHEAEPGRSPGVRARSRPALMARRLPPFFVAVGGRVLVEDRAQLRQVVGRQPALLDHVGQELAVHALERVVQQRVGRPGQRLPGRPRRAVEIARPDRRGREMPLLHQPAQQGLGRASGPSRAPRRLPRTRPARSSSFAARRSSSPSIRRPSMARESRETSVTFPGGYGTRRTTTNITGTGAVSTKNFGNASEGAGVGEKVSRVWRGEPSSEVRRVEPAPKPESAARRQKVKTPVLGNHTSTYRALEQARKQAK